MKDQFFTGASVELALQQAAVALGMPAERLRYVVLERETPARLGLSATPARIAVILDVRPQATAGPPRGLPARAPQPGVGELLQVLGQALGLPLEAESQGDEEREVLELRGPACERLFDPEGRAFQALEHLVGRLCAAQDLDAPRLSCPAYREARNRWLGDRARQLCADVLSDGQPRETEPMNAYDRRQVHMVVGDLPGLTTRSVGEGSARRVTILLAGAVPSA